MNSFLITVEDLSKFDDLISEINKNNLTIVNAFSMLGVVAVESDLPVEKLRELINYKVICSVEYSRTVYTS